MRWKEKFSKLYSTGTKVATFFLLVLQRDGSRSLLGCPPSDPETLIYYFQDGISVSVTPNNFPPPYPIFFLTRVILLRQISLVMLILECLRNLFCSRNQVAPKTQTCAKEHTAIPSITWSYTNSRFNCAFESHQNDLYQSQQ